ncbi:hypothetical protein [Herbidospora mongoliensis]|uniref:hypothetical protein n=1 Tax=Herbidospora mongoliensis TaxID=688067 RepID=UPI000833968A|nr:hypothetical protein [Herbidospora mongoliensis]
MSSDQMPGGLDRIINDLRRDVAELKRQAGIKTGLQIKQSSGAFNVVSSSDPGTPVSGWHLWSDSGTFKIKHSNGVVRTIPAAGVSNASFSSGSISNPPTQAQVTNVQSGVSSAVTTVNNLLAVLRDANLITS